MKCCAIVRGSAGELDPAPAQHAQRRLSRRARSPCWPWWNDSCPEAEQRLRSAKCAYIDIVSCTDATARRLSQDFFLRSRPRGCPICKPKTAGDRPSLAQSIHPLHPGYYCLWPRHACLSYAASLRSQPAVALALHNPQPRYRLILHRRQHLHAHGFMPQQLPPQAQLI